VRSLLFVPGHDARKLARGLASGADALILDLEDAVPDADKPRARGLCAEFVAAHRDDLRLFVRVNGTDTGLILDDLAAVVRARPFGVILPKCGGGPELARLDAQLAALEVRDGIAVGTVRVLPIVTETAAAVLGTGGYAGAGARLVGMTWGGEDLAADIGALANRDAQGRYTEPYRLARSLTLLAATAAQVIAVDAVYIDFRDVDGLRREAADALRDGFTAKLAIHPDQVGPINEAFTPSADAIERARRVIAAFDAAPGAGAVALDGRMLDRPHRRSAERVLARAAGTGAPR
jgi:citrate lyase subunit beta / citryl-CoA lyase